MLNIKERHPNCQFFAPLGNKKWFEDVGIHNITEMDWWETRELTLSRMVPNGQKTEATEAESGVNNGKETEMVATIGCLPCQHMAARTMFDKAHTLWSSWCVESGGKKVWFAG